MIGTEIQNYRIIQMLGKGGMATVYKAQHKTLAGTFAAIKVLHPALAQDDNIRLKFRKEAQLMSTFSHPAIGRVYDYAEDGGNLYLIMEYLEGPTLDELIRLHTGPIVEKRAKEIFSKILGGVGYAHSKGIIHRDLKPANIIITANDEPKIIDFGIVKMLQDEGHPGATRTGQRIGTPLFMSPEQIIGRGVDHRSDIYALGITLFQMVTGQLPYDPEALSQFEIEQKIVNEPLPQARALYPAVSPQIQAAIDKATAKRKEDRFNSCEEFAAALHQPAPNLPPPVPPTPPPVAAQPQILFFTADKNTLTAGEGVTLSWNVRQAATVTISPLGNFAASGTHTVYPTADTTYTLQAGAATGAVFVAVRRRKNAALLPIILLVAVAAGVFFLIKNYNLLGMEDSGTPATQTPSPQENKRVRIDPPATSFPQPATPLPQNQPQDTPVPGDDVETVETQVSPREANNIRNVLLRYVTLSESRGEGVAGMDVDGILNMFAYPVRRYFNQTNVGPDAITAELQRYYNNVVLETAWEIDWDDLTYNRSPSGEYIVSLSGPYTYRGRNTGEVKTRMVSNQVVLNEDYKIVSIYEIK